MFLSSDAIRGLVEAGDGLVIEPFDDRWLKPASYVLHLGKLSRRWPQSVKPLWLWDAEEDPQEPPAEEHRTITLDRGDLVLAASQELISIPPGLVGFISTLSHLARAGVSVHANSYLVSPGFGGSRPTVLTLELTSANPAPVVLSAGQPLCHLALMRVEGPEHDHDRPLDHSVYEGDRAPSGPRLIKEMGPLIPRRQEGHGR